jgi:hypothetical protein
MPEFARRPVGTKLQAGSTFAAGVQPAEFGNNNLACGMRAEQRRGSGQSLFRERWFAPHGDIESRSIKRVANDAH